MELGEKNNYCFYHLQIMCECSLVFVAHVLRPEKCTMIQSFAIELISINRREKNVSYMTNVATDVMLTGELDDQ